MLVPHPAHHRGDEDDQGLRQKHREVRELDQDGRQRMVEMLWEIVLADGVLHEFESNLMWRASELLGVSTQDRVRLRKLVESRA